MDSKGSVVHHLNFQVNERQRSSLIFAVINTAHSKTVFTLSHEAVVCIRRQALKCMQKLCNKCLTSNTTYSYYLGIMYNTLFYLGIANYKD